MNKAFLGIDVSKGYGDFVLLNEDFEVLSKPLQFDDTSKGHQYLNGWLTDQINTHNLSAIYAGVESTGGFENNWHTRFIDLGKTLPVQIARLNPMAVKSAAKATLSDQITDAMSAYHIAAYLIRYGEEVSWGQPETEYRSYRSFDSHIRLLIRQRTQLIAQFKQLLYSCFPEMQRFCKNEIPNWVLELLKAYPTPARLCRARATTVARINYISLQKAQTLIENAKNSVAGRGSYSDGYLIECMAGQIQATQQQITRLKATLAAECKGPETALLETINGIGTDSAVAIMIQIEDIRRFASPSQLAGYFGVYPAVKQSGDKKPVVRMSKKGRSAMRATLYMCANNAVLHDPHLKEIYHRHRKKGKSHKQALGVIMHKLLRIIWGVLTSKKAYDPRIDQAHQQKKAPPKANQQKQEIAAKRRVQPFDPEAPISRIAAKKRKAYQQSQVSSAERIRDRIDTPVDKDKEFA